MLHFCKYFVPIFLIVIALNQYFVSKNSTLTAWKGGGFGMFATNEHRRFLKFYLVVENKQKQKLYYPLSKSKEYLHEMNQLSSYPTEKRCQDLALQIHEDEQIGKGKWIYVAVYSADYRNRENVEHVVRSGLICSGNSEQAQSRPKK